MKSRKTLQKITIDNAIATTTSFFSAEELLKEVRKEDERIGLATIYRHLKRLRDTERIYSYSCNGKRVYSKENKSHCHFICENTGKILHFNVESLDFLKDKIPGDIHSFQIEVRGVCTECQSDPQRSSHPSKGNIM
ncbi:MAG: Fur family transcriptional regulator [Nanoarchaeota archaeon]